MKIIFKIIKWFVIANVAMFAFIIALGFIIPNVVTEEQAAKWNKEECVKTYGEQYCTETGDPTEEFEALSYYDKVNIMYDNLSDYEKEDTDNPVTKAKRGYACATSTYMRAWTVTEAVKRSLKNPKSFEFESGYISDLRDNNTYAYSMTYFATNSFNAVTRGHVNVILNADCSIREVVSAD